MLASAMACYHPWVDASTMSKDEREKFYPVTGRIVSRRDIRKFCDNVENAIVNSGLSRCEALGCLAIIIAREANAEPDPPHVFAVAHEEAG